MFRVYDPALVLLDVNTAGMTGIETLERLKQIKPDVSVIMLSTQQDADFIFKASKLGADDYIGKPFEPKDLDQRMARVLERERQVVEVSQLRDQVRRRGQLVERAHDGRRHRIVAAAGTQGGHRPLDPPR